MWISVKKEFIPVIKAEFSSSSTVFSVTCMYLLLKDNFWLLAMLKKVVLQNIFVETVIHFCNTVFDKQHLFEIEIFITL